ncbi:MAG: Serine/threonine protein kinase [Verrucomicrobia bacterium]|nr:MAG: Serine/threonine protein kinase [Verrucomicrobiota bacterium]
MPNSSAPLLNTCPECTGVIDVSAVRPFEKISCPHCGRAVRVRINFGKFTILAEIGEGGMSRVFRAQDSTLGREVALKVLHSHFGDQPELIAQFEKEARLTASINHANVVQVYSVGRDQGYFYIAMELLQSENLDTKLASGPLPEASALRLIHEVAQGLAAAAKIGLIHRDIKPGNILFDRSGTAKLVDFGLALVLGTEEEMADLWATPHYVPPEKLKGLPDDLRGDIYSLGATLFHLLAGKPPHTVDTVSTGEILQIKSQPANLRAAAPRLRGRTIALVNRMMAFDPKDRFNNYAELIRAIEEARAAADPHFVVPGRPRKRPVWLQAASGAAGGLLLLAMVAQFFKPREGDQDADSKTPPPLRPGGGELIVSADQAARLRSVEIARKRYAEGNTAEALDLFAKAEKDDKMAADVRAWAAFHLATEAAIKGNTAEAKRLFTMATTHARNSSSALAEWFESVEKGTASAEDPLAALALGCQAFSAGDYPVAADLLQRYQSAKFSAEEAWKGLYQPTCQAALADALLLRTLPGEPARDDPAAVQTALDGWTALFAKLRQPSSRQFAQGKITNLGTALVQAQLKGLEAAKATDHQLLLETSTKALDFAKSRNFASASAAWAKAVPTSEWGRERARLAADACSRAGQFVVDFVSKVGETGYSGPILRTSGQPFAARIVSATADKLLVDLGFGPTPIDFSAISSAGILQIAKTTFLPKAGPDVLERAAFFAWLSGDTEYAKELSRQLHDLPGFADRWEALILAP